MDDFSQEPDNRQETSQLPLERFGVLGRHRSRARDKGARPDTATRPPDIATADLMELGDELRYYYGEWLAALPSANAQVAPGAPGRNLLFAPPQEFQLEVTQRNWRGKPSAPGTTEPASRLRMTETFNVDEFGVQQRYATMEIRACRRPGASSKSAFITLDGDTIVELLSEIASEANIDEPNSIAVGWGQSLRTREEDTPSGLRSRLFGIRTTQEGLLRITWPRRTGQAEMDKPSIRLEILFHGPYRSRRIAKLKLTPGEFDAFVGWLLVFAGVTQP